MSETSEISFTCPYCDRQVIKPISDFVGRDSSSVLCPHCGRAHDVRAVAKIIERAQKTRDDVLKLLGNRTDKIAEDDA